MVPDSEDAPSFIELSSHAADLMQAREALELTVRGRDEIGSPLESAEDALIAAVEGQLEMWTSTESAVTFWAFWAASWNVEPAGRTNTLTSCVRVPSTRPQVSGFPAGWGVSCAE